MEQNTGNQMEPSKKSPLFFCSKNDLFPGGVLNFELGTDVRPDVSTTTL